MKLIDYYNKFMKNRYGIDELNKFIIKVFLIILFINIFINIRILSYCKLIIALIFMFRYFSKNKFDRSKENRIYLDIKSNRFRLKRNNNHMYIYKKCRKCKKKLRLPLPSSIGIKTVKCPNCKNMMKVLVVRKK